MLPVTNRGSWELDELREKYDAVLGSDASDYSSVADKISAYEALQAEISKNANALAEGLPEKFKKISAMPAQAGMKRPLVAVEVLEKQAPSLDYDFVEACR